MRLIEFECSDFGTIRFYGSQLHSGHDCIFKSNAKNSNIDFLVFFDSRGVSSSYKNSLADKIVKQIELNGASYLLICRPVNLTTWATLVNFIKINELSPSKIITNLGFVDFTPKKFDIINEAIEQVQFSMGKDIAFAKFAQKYMSLKNGEVDLYFTEYSNKYKKFIEDLTKKIETIIINSPDVSKDICIQRPRPDSFYIGLEMANNFNRSIEAVEIVDFLKFDRSLTYDAVHWTELGNDYIFGKIKGYI